MEQVDIENLIGELETRVERLRSLYDQYFMGIEKLEPGVPRKDVDRRIHVLRKEQIRNTGLRFRFQMILQRYNTYQSYWVRICRQIEDGTYKRHMMRAQARFGEGTPRAKPGSKFPTPSPPEIPSLESDMAMSPRAMSLDLDDAFGELGDDSLDSGFGVLDDPLTRLPSSASIPAVKDPMPSPAKPLRAAPPPPPQSASERRIAVAGDPRVAGPRALAPPLPPGAKRDGSTPQPADSAAKVVWRKAAPAASSSEGQLAANNNTPPAQRAAPPLAPRPAAPVKNAPHAPPTPATTSPAGASPRPPVPARPAPPPLPPRPAAAPAPARDVAPPPAPKREDLPEERVRQLYAQYVDTKRKQNESTAAITYDGLAKSLRESSAKLREKHGRHVDFEIAVKDGKTVIRPVVK